MRQFLTTSILGPSRTALVIGVLIVVCLPALAWAEAMWDVKAVHGDRLLPIKAIAGTGRLYDIKAIRTSGGVAIMDVLAIGDVERWPIRLLDRGKPGFSVKAIRPDGTLMDVKAIGANGARLSVVGAGQVGHIVHIKVVTSAAPSTYAGVKAFGPHGNTYAIKGLRFSGEAREGKVSGIPHAGYVKAVPFVLE